MVVKEWVHIVHTWGLIFEEVAGHSARGLCVCYRNDIWYNVFVFSWMVVIGIYGETYYMNRDIGELPNNNKKKCPRYTSALDVPEAANTLQNNF